MKDSLFVTWRPNYTDQSLLVDITTFIISDIFEDSIKYVKTVKNYAVINAKESVVLKLRREFRERQYISGDIFLRKAKPAEAARVNFDLGRLRTNDDRLYLESAIYYINKTIFDSSFCLYKIMKSKKTTNDPILTKYFEVLYNEYEYSKISVE